MLKLLDQFSNYLEYERRYSNHTVNSYRVDLTQFIEFCQDQYEISDIKAIRHPIVRSWIVSMIENGYVNKTINRKISSLRTFYNFLKRRNLVDVNPMLKIVAPKIPKRLPSFIKEQEISALFDNLNEDVGYSSFRNRIIIELLYTTGMRRSELMSLQESNVSFTDGYLKVLGKGGKERIIPLNEIFLKKLKRLLELKQGEFPELESSKLFVTDRGKPIYPKFIYNVVVKLLGTVTTSAKKSPHVLRHSFATHLTNNGADINAIKELLGHANLAATQIYTHNSIKKLKDVYKNSHPKASKG